MKVLINVKRWVAFIMQNNWVYNVMSNLLR